MRAQRPPVHILNSNPSAARLNNLDFDKKEWIREFKQLKKDFLLEDRERYRPLLNLKRDLKDYCEDIEKEEKKQEIAIKKEFSQLLVNIDKQKQEVLQARNMINQSKQDPSYLDRIHGKVKGIEQNLKNFKLKSRSAYEQLVDEEALIENELQMWEDKFDQYMLEKSNDQFTSNIGAKKVGQRANSVSNRLFSKAKTSVRDESDDEERQESNALTNIKVQLEKIDDQIQHNGGLNCGWDAADHKDFLRIRTKHNNKTTTIAFMQEIMRAVPTIDDQAIKLHINKYERYLDLTEQKKQTLFAYKEAKKKKQQETIHKIDNQNRLFGKINSDLDLIIGDFDGQQNENNKNAQNVEERERLKQELDKWKKEKVEEKKREQLEKKRLEEEQKYKHRSVLDEERRQKKEQIEEFKFKKEMEKQREKQLQEMEKRKQKEQILSQEQKERIFKREEEVFQKKHMLIINKQQEKEDKEFQKELLKEKMSKGFKDKVKSKLNVETKTMKDKKRDKFDPTRDRGRDAMTMGGNLLGVSVRAMPFWRQGL
eukprot:403357622